MPQHQVCNDWCAWLSAVPSMYKAEAELDCGTYLQVVVIDRLVVQDLGLHGSHQCHSIKLSPIPKHTRK